MFTWIKQILYNVSDFISGIVFTVGLSVIFLAAGIMGSVMCLFGTKTNPDELFKNIRYGVVTP